MDSITISFTLLISFILGAAIGIEREINEKNIINGKIVSVLGLRSFALIATLGAVAGILYTNFIGFSILISAAFLVLLIVFYVLDTNQTKDTGITTELAMLFCFIIGILIATTIIPVQVTIAMTAVLALTLSQKRAIKQVIGGIKRAELNAFISYAIIALVILPFLPNTSYALKDIPGLTNFFNNAQVPVNGLFQLEIVNPFKLWLIVALITGVDLIGYILERTLGRQKGWILASIAGGFISSTATTQSLALQSKTSKDVNHLLSAALIANLVSFFQIAILLSPLNITFVIRLLPILGLMIVSSLAVTIFFTMQSSKKKLKPDKSHEKETEIFALSPAIKFAGIFLVISILSKVALKYFGSSGFLVTTGIGALAGLDAVMINTAQLSGTTVSYQLAAIAFILANAVNLIGKTAYSYFLGTKEFTVKFGLSVMCIIVTSVLGLFLI